MAGPRWQGRESTMGIITQRRRRWHPQHPVSFVQWVLLAAVVLLTLLVAIGGL